MLPLIPLAISLVPGLTKWLFGDTAATTVQAVTSAVQAATGTTEPTQAATVLARNPSLTNALTVQLAQIAAAHETAADATRQAELLARLNDLAGARSRDLAVRAAGDGRNVRADIMLCAVGLGLLACIITAALGWLGDQAAFGLVAGIAGMLSGCFKDAFGFEFGSSRQSEAKTDMLANSVPKDLLTSAIAQISNGAANNTATAPIVAAVAPVVAAAAAATADNLNAAELDKP